MTRLYALAAMVLGSNGFLYAQEKPIAVATTTVIADIARNIGGDVYSYRTLNGFDDDPHLHTNSSADSTLLASASIVFVNGLGLDTHVASLAAKSGKRPLVITASTGVATIKSQTYANEADPHAWMDAANGLIYAQNIRDGMIISRPEFELQFRQNYNDYKQAIEDVDQYITRRITSIPPNKRILITYHEAFAYYGRRYGLSFQSALGISTESDLLPSGSQRIERTINNTEVTAIFAESADFADWMNRSAEQWGLAPGGILYADVLSPSDGPADTYIKMLRYNTDVIQAALTQERVKEPPAQDDHVNYNWLWGLVLAPIVAAAGLFVYRAFQQ